MKKLLFRVVLGVAAGLFVYVGFSVWADARRVGEALATFHWSAVLAGLGLATANYVIRFVRWHYYLRVLGLVVPAGESFLVFLAGFSLTVTPGKLGEAVKALLLRDARGIPAARTAPIVLAERATDLVGLLLLATVGAARLGPDLRAFLIAGALVVGLGLVVVSVDSLALPAIALAARLPGLRRLAPKLRQARDSAAAVLRPAPLAIAVVLSVAAWFLECVAFHVVVSGFDGATLSLYNATWIYAAMTVAGALSFLPGGLGVSEAVMLALLVRFGIGTERGVAAAATFVTRGCTLWFAVVVGLGALLIFARRKHVAITLPGGDSPAQSGENL
jgi:uncharacterized membrane protein YbhN (UPF0104 family)